MLTDIMGISRKIQTMTKKLQDKWPSFFKNKIAKGKNLEREPVPKEISKAHQPTVICRPYLGLCLKKPTSEKLLRMY